MKPVKGAAPNRLMLIVVGILIIVVRSFLSALPARVYPLQNPRETLLKPVHNPSPQAAAIAIPVGIIYSKGEDTVASPSFPPPASPPSYSVQVAFTASGDVSDYDQAKQDNILSTIATAAGFAAVPAGATLSATPGSVSFVADFPVSDSVAMASAKAKLQGSMSDQKTVQTLLAAAVPGIIIESAPVVNSNDGTTYPPPPPFALVGHWLSGYGSGLTYTNDHVITISKWTKELAPIVEYSADYYVIQKPSDDAYNANKFQKIFFHSNGDGTFSTCAAGPRSHAKLLSCVPQRLPFGHSLSSDPHPHPKHVYVLLCS